MEGTEFVLSAGQLAGVLESGSLLSPITVQITAKDIKLTKEGDKVTELTVSDSETHAVIRLGPKIDCKSVEGRKLKAFNVVDLKRISVLKNPMLIVLLEYENIRDCSKRIGNVPIFSKSFSAERDDSGQNKRPKKRTVGGIFESASVDRRFLSLKDLTDFNYKLGYWVKGKVVKKHPVRSVQWDDKYGDVFSFIIDDGSSDMKVSAWNDCASWFDNKIKEGAGYIFHGYSVKPILPSKRIYNQTRHEFEMTLNDISQAVEDDSVSQIDIAPPEYTSISVFPEMNENSVLNFRGIVIRLGDRQYVKGRTGRLAKRDVTVCDKSAVKTEVLLWEDLATQNLVRGEAYLFEEFKLSRDAGLTLRSTTTSRIVEDCNKDVRLWYENIGRTLDLKHVRQFLDQSAMDTSVSCFDVLCASLVDDEDELFTLFGPVDPKTRTKSFCGVFRLIQHDRLRAYVKCSHCGRTLEGVDFRSVRVECINCTEVTSPLTIQYSANLIIADHTSHIDVVAYTDLLTNLNVKLGKDVDHNIVAITDALNMLSFGVCFMGLKLDMKRKSPRAILLTSIVDCSLEFVKRNAEILYSKELNQLDGVEKVYNEYWKNSYGYAVYPVSVVDLMFDHREETIGDNKYRLFACVGILSGMSFEADTKIFKIGDVKNPSAIFVNLEDPCNQFDVDDDQVGHSFEVIVKKRVGRLGDIYLTLIAVIGIEDEYVRYDHNNRQSKQEIIRKMDNLYRCRSGGSQDYVNMTLSPRMKNNSLNDEPMAKRFKD